MKKIFLLFVLIANIASSQITQNFDWHRNGNTVSTNTAFIGTNDNRSLLFKTNGTQVGKLDSLGNFSLRSSNAGFNVATSFNIKNTSSTGYSKLLLDSDDGLTTIGFYNLNSGGTLGSILNNNSAFVVATATAGTGIINTTAGPIIFNTTTYGSSGEGMRVDKNRNVLIAGAGPTHPVNSGTATALFHIGVSTATYPQIHLDPSAAPTTPIAGDLWREITRGFLFNGRITSASDFSVNATTTLTGVSYVASTLNVGVGSNTFNPGALFSVLNPTGAAVSSVYTRTNNSYSQFSLGANTATSSTSFFHSASSYPSGGLYLANSFWAQFYSQSTLFDNAASNTEFVFAIASIEKARITNSIVTLSTSFGTNSVATIGSTVVTAGQPSLNVIGNASVSTNFTVGANAKITGTLSVNTFTACYGLMNTATLDFPSTNAGLSSELTITVTGAVDGDPVIGGGTNATTSVNGIFSYRVSAANTVTVRYNNTNLLTAVDPPSGTFKVVVNKN